MARYKYTDPETGQVFKLELDHVPNDAELKDLVSKMKGPTVRSPNSSAQRTTTQELESMGIPVTAGKAMVHGVGSVLGAAGRGIDEVTRFGRKVMGVPQQDGPTESTGEVLAQALMPKEDNPDTFIDKSYNILNDLATGSLPGTTKGIRNDPRARAFGHGAVRTAGNVARDPMTYVGVNAPELFTALGVGNLLEQAPKAVEKAKKHGVTSPEFMEDIPDLAASTAMTVLPAVHAARKVKAPAEEVTPPQEEVVSSDHEVPEDFKGPVRESRELPIDRIPKEHHEVVKGIIDKHAQALAQSGRTIDDAALLQDLPPELHEHAPAVKAQAIEDAASLIDGQDLIDSMNSFHGEEGPDGETIKETSSPGNFDIVQRAGGKIVGGARVHNNTLAMITGGKAMKSPVSIGPVYRLLDHLGVKRNDVTTSMGAKSRRTYAGKTGEVGLPNRGPGTAAGEETLEQGSTPTAEGSLPKKAPGDEIEISTDDIIEPKPQSVQAELLSPEQAELGEMHHGDIRSELRNIDNTIARKQKDGSYGDEETDQLESRYDQLEAEMRRRRTSTGEALNKQLQAGGETEPTPEPEQPPAKTNKFEQFKQDQIAKGSDPEQVQEAVDRVKAEKLGIPFSPKKRKSKFAPNREDLSTKAEILPEGQRGVGGTPKGIPKAEPKENTELSRKQEELLGGQENPFKVEAPKEESRTVTSPETQSTFVKDLSKLSEDQIMKRAEFLKAMSERDPESTNFVIGEMKRLRSEVGKRRGGSGAPPKEPKLFKRGEGDRPPEEPGTVQTIFENIMSIPRSLKQIGSPAHFVGRQGITQTAAHPVTSVKAGIQAYKSMFSEKADQKYWDEVEKTPYGAPDTSGKNTYEKAGLEITTPAKRAQREEEFYGENVLNKAPVVGPAIRGSERGFTTGLNRLRIDRYNQLAEKLDAGNFDDNPEIHQAIADYVNHATGRGDLGKTGNAASRLLSTIFYSPRLQVSRLRLMDPTYYAKLAKTSPKLAAEAGLDMAKFAGATLSALALAKAAGATVETDPTKPNFAKAKFGKVAVDFTGGFPQWITFIAREIKGGKRKGFRAETFKRFMEYRLAPGVPSLAAQLAEDKDFSDPGRKPGAGTAVSQITPMPVDPMVQKMLDGKDIDLNDLLELGAGSLGGSAREQKFKAKSR